MAFIVFIDGFMTTSIIIKLYNLQKLLSLRDSLSVTQKPSKKRKSKKKSKKTVKREEIKVQEHPDIESLQVCEPIVAEEINEEQPLDMSMQSVVSENSLIKNIPAERIAPRPVQQYIPPTPVQPAPQILPCGYPATLQIDGQTFIAVKASDLNKVQRLPPQAFYLAPNPSNL